MISLYTLAFAIGLVKTMVDLNLAAYLAMWTVVVTTLVVILHAAAKIQREARSAKP